MNPFIKEQLNLVRVASLPQFDDTTTFIKIPKTEFKPNINLTTGKEYFVQLENYITNPPENFTLHDNWNNGNIPKYDYMRCKVDMIMGKMVKVTGSAVDTKTFLDLDYNWSGWLPYKSINIIKELT